MNYEQKFWASLIIANIWVANWNMPIVCIWCAIAVLFLVLKHVHD